VSVCVHLSVPVQDIQIFSQTHNFEILHTSLALVFMYCWWIYFNGTVKMCA